MSSLLLTQRAKIQIKLKSKKRYTEKIPKHTKIASFLLHLTPALSSLCLHFIFIVPSLSLHCVSALSYCTFTLSSLRLRSFITCPYGSHRLTTTTIPTFPSLHSPFGGGQGEVSFASPPLHSPSPWEKSPNRRVCDWGEDSLSFASKPRFYHF